MSIINNRIETDIKRELSKLYKGAFGKGPDNTDVKIFANFVFLKFTGAFSPIEESLLNSEVGRQIVGEIRDELILTQTSIYLPTVERIVNEKVRDVSYMLDEVNKNIYVFLLFEKELKVF